MALCVRLNHCKYCSVSGWIKHLLYGSKPKHFTWHPAFSSIFAYLTVFSISGKTRILQVIGTESFSSANLTVKNGQKKIQICCTPHTLVKLFKDLLVYSRRTHFLQKVPLILKKHTVMPLERITNIIHRRIKHVSSQIKRSGTSFCNHLWASQIQIDGITTILSEQSSLDKHFRIIGTEL